MSEPTTQEKVLQVFRGVAHNLNTQSEKAAAREHELKPLLAEARAGREVLTKQIEALKVQAAELDGEIERMADEHDEAAAFGKAAREQGAYAFRVVALAEEQDAALPAPTVTQPEGVRA